MHLNIEIKARSTHHEKLRELLNHYQARYIGLDHQVDTYFIVPKGKGRLKLREGNIEYSLIHYHRRNQDGPKKSEVTLYHAQPDTSLKTILANTFGVWKVVDKKRHIYFIDNVKFHLDEVKGLGSFVEIEAIDKDGNIGEEKLIEQCQYYLKLFGIEADDLIESSYSDLI